MYRAALCALLLVLAGCQGPVLGGEPTETATDIDEQTPTPGATETSTEGETGTDAETGNDGATDADLPPAPEDDDEVLGYEEGYWHNESLSVTTADGLNETERDAAVARAMARVEYVREREFEESVPVEVISRDEYRAETSRNYTETFRRFDNAKFEALFLVGEDEDALEVQEQTLGESVLGYYDPQEQAIVIVSDSETPTLDGEGTLAHELVHALQDQHFGLQNGTADTRDAHQGRNGVVEGDASFTEGLYTERCGEEWQCLPPAESGDSGGDAHFGINFLMFFPYSDGPGFVESLYGKDDWASVDEAYGDLPDGSPEVIYPDRYPEWEPREVSIEDDAGNGWERVRPPNRTDHARLGQSAIAATLAYTLADDYNRERVVRPEQVVNFRDDGSVDRDDPYNYDVAAAAGWEGGRMHVYERDGETAYVWRTAWANESEAAEFADQWAHVIEHWGGQPAGDGVWVIDDGPFADAFEIRQEGDTVTVVNAPAESDLDDVHGS